MTTGPDPEALPPATSPYLHFADCVSPPEGPRLHSGTVRLIPDAAGRAKGFARLAGALRQGLAVVAPEDAEALDPEGQRAAWCEPFTLYWRDEDLPDRLVDVLEVFDRARPVRIVEPTPDGKPTDRRTDGPPAIPPLRPEPDASPMSGPRAAILRSHPAPLVAVIDDGIGFLHRRFCRRDGGLLRTRFHAVWLQAFRTVPHPLFGPSYTLAGQVLQGAEIDALLALGPRLEEGKIYRALNRQLLESGAHRSSEYGFSHGTHIMDTAAGADPDGEGEASRWPLLAVQLPSEAVDHTSGVELEPMIVRGVAWILHKAARIGGMAPVVINISFATFAGPKDGTKAIEAQIARRLGAWQARTGRVARVVLAFGNDRLNRQAARMDLIPGAAQRIDWRLQPDDRAASYLEIRSDAGADLGALSMAITCPGGAEQPLGPLPANAWRTVHGPFGAPVGRLYHIGPRITAPGTLTPAHLVLAAAPTLAEAGRMRAPFGAWRIALSAARAMTVRIEVQRGDTPRDYRPNGRQSRLDHPLAHAWDTGAAAFVRPGPGCPITRAGTHSSFVTAPSPAMLCVGAARGDTGAPSPYSAEGAPWTRPAPSLAAIADRGPALRGVVGAGTHSGAGRTLDGTSVAAARVTRALAEIWATGGVQDQPDPQELARLIAERGAPGAPVFVPRQGAGVIAP